MSVEDLKNKGNISREDIAQLLSSIGKPGKNREQKIAALEELNQVNRQGHNIALTAESYPEW